MKALATLLRNLANRLSPLPGAIGELTQPTETTADWTRTEQGALRRFLESPAGARLRARVAATAYLNLKLAAGIGSGMVQPNLATPPGERAARAGGYLECWQHIESLSRASIRDTKLDTDELSLAGQGEPELSEPYTP